MRGVGRASGAITFVNALHCGQGCAAAIDLGCEVAVELERTLPGELPRTVIDPGSDTPLVRAALAHGLRATAPTEKFDVRLSVRSAIPWARGLKSSSAVTVAVLEAVSRAYGTLPEPAFLARTSAELSRSLGISATGAFDDALAAIGGGVVLTDNANFEVLATGAAGSEWEVAIWFPPEEHAASSSLAGRFQGNVREGQLAMAEAMTGDYLAAMLRNTRLVEKALRYGYGPMRVELLRQGALGAGVCGMGPAIAAVAPGDRLVRVSEAFPQSRGEVILTRFRAEGELPSPLTGREEP
jgi:shikimate kinase